MSMSVGDLLRQLRQQEINSRIRLVRHYPLVASATEQELMEAALSLISAEQMEQHLRGGTQLTEIGEFAPPPARSAPVSIRQNDQTIDALFEG